MTWTFHLRDDVRWHDGEPFTAHDVDFTFNRIIYNHDIPASSRPAFHFRFLNEETGKWEEVPMTVRALDDFHGRVRSPAALRPVPPLHGHRDIPETHPREARRRWEL